MVCLRALITILAVVTFASARAPLFHPGRMLSLPSNRRLVHCSLPRVPPSEQRSGGLAGSLLRGRPSARARRLLAPATHSRTRRPHQPVAPSASRPGSRVCGDHRRGRRRSANGGVFRTRCISACQGACAAACGRPCVCKCTLVNSCVMRTARLDVLPWRSSSLA